MRIILIIFSQLIFGQFLFGQTSGGFTSSNVQIQSEIANNTVLRGTVDAPTSSTITFRFFKNTISFEEDILVTPLLADNSFEVSFKLSTPTILVVNYDGNDMRIFVEPGDETHFGFKGNAFPESVQFDGTGSTHNEYINSFQQEFSDWNVDYLLFEMSRRDAMDFRQFMDGLRLKKWTFFQTYSLDKKLSFSKDFIAYIHAEIDYWWAYNLIKFRIEKPLYKGLPVPMKLPDTYYTFLNEVIISNDQALSNRYYLEFLEEYINLRHENALPVWVLEGGASFFFVDAAMVMLMEQPNEMPVLTEPKQGERLKYLGKHSDFKSKGNYRGKTREDYWYNVETKDGTRGWVLGVGLQRIEHNLMHAAPNATFVNSASKIERYIVTKVDGIRVLENPYDEKNVLTVLNRNTELSYLLNKTTETFKYPHDNTTYIDYFYKIKTPSGTIGWIPQFAFSFKEREVRNSPSSSKNKSNEDLRDFLTGQTLYYGLAKDLFWKTHQNNLEEVGRAIAKFRDENPYACYTKILSAAYEIAQLKGKGDKAFINTYAYSVIRTPIVKGVSMEMPYQASKQSKPAIPIVSANDLREYIDIDARPKMRSTTPTQIRGTISLPNKYKASLIIYSDPILFKERRFDLDKDFTYNIHLAEPIVGVIEYGAEKIPVYLEPGDRLSLTASGGSLQKSIVYKGKGSQHNQYLLEAQRFFESINREMETKVRYAQADEFRDFMDKAIRKKHIYRERYLKKSNFTSGFKTHIKADIDYWYAFHLLNYTIEHPLYEGKNDRMHVPQAYYSFLNQIDVSPEDVLPNANYTYFLNEYLTFLSEKPEHQGLSQQELAEQFLTKEAQYFIKAKGLSIACKQGKGMLIGHEIKQFIEDCPYETYNDVLRFIYNDSKGLIAGTSAPNFTLNDIEGKEVSLSDLRGKVVFLDFWATWCNPCVRSLYHSKKLSQTFADKDVAFVYVSLDENKTDWQQYLAEHDLGGIHLYSKTPNIYQSEIAKLYKVNKLPTYILIDQNGKIAFNPAKNPGNSQLINQINDLLSRGGASH